MTHSRSIRMVAALAGVVLLLAACSDSATSDGASQDVGQGLVPDEVVALIGQWNQATETSMADLYTPRGFHLYGAQIYTGDDIFAHLSNPAVSHEDLTPLLLLAAEQGRRYVVTQGMENAIGATKIPSSLTWEIVADSEGTLRIAHSAWS